MTTEERTPGHAAYDKWADIVHVPGGFIPMDWEQMSPEGQAGWEAIAEEAIEQYRQNTDNFGH